MSDFSATLHVHWSHEASKPRPIYIEPWGEDYWLFPGDQFEVIAFSQKTVPHFEIVESDESTQVYFEPDCHKFVIKQAEHHLKCGHQRAKLVGSVAHAFTIIGRGVVIASNRPWQAQLKIGDELRLFVPKKKVIRASLLGFEHFNAGGSTILENPWGVFLGELGVEASEIPSGSSVYQLEQL